MSLPARNPVEPQRPVQNQDVRDFWEKNPVAASGIDAVAGTLEFFAKFDAIREADDCEPYEFSNRIHGYESAQGKRVLDIGCGNGYVLSRYARHGAEAHGLDITGTALDLSRKRFEFSGDTGKFDLTDGETIPYDDGYFDIVCSMGVLHHIEDPSPMVDEIHRVLKPGGAVILMLYYRYSWKNLVVLRLRRLFDPRYRGKTQAQALNMNDGDDCPLAKVYSRSEARALLSRFEGHRTQLNQLSWKQLFLLPPLARALGAVLPSCSESVFARTMGWNLYIRAIKPHSTEPLSR